MSIIIKKFFYKVQYIFILFLVNITHADLLESTFSKSLGESVAKDTSMKNYFGNATTVMLRVAIGLGIAMIIFGGVKFILSLGDEGKMKKARSNIVMVITGLVLALSSLAIVLLINSITKSSIN